MLKELLIFIGHSSDAIKEVEAVCSLEAEFQKFLRRHVKNIDSPTSSIKMFMWENDANLGVGGQRVAINPYLENADIALFIFKEKIGKVTWEELQYCKENHIRTVAIFPAEPPYPNRLNEEAYIDQWMDLVKKKKSLTEDWSSENSTSITPVDPYFNIEDLKGIVREKISDLIPDVIFKQIQKHSQNNSDLNKSKIQLFGLDLNEASGTLEFSSAIVANYRSKLRMEYKSKYPESLNELVFLRNIGFVKNEKLTLAGVLLFSDQPTKHLKSALTRASKYEGKDKSSSKVRMDIDDSIINQILLSREFIENHIESRDHISNNSSESKRIFKYPMKCIREVLANALCHRDYSDNSRFVYITIYEDRIEISNPGEWGNRILTEGESILFTDIKGRPVEKNLSLARAISAINFMEMEGSGIETAIMNCIEERAPIPEVIFENGYVTVKIRPRKNWDIYTLQYEVTLGESDKPILLDKAAAKGAMKSHLNFVKNWAKEMSFQDMRGTKSIKELTVNIHLRTTHFKSSLLEQGDSIINLSDLLSQNKNCLIVGQPGTGKTTAIKILANTILNKSKSKSKFDLPIIVLLREIRSITYSNFYSFLARHLGFLFRIEGKELNFSSKTELSQGFLLQIKKELIAFFEENKVILLLDGLDEIADYNLRLSVLKDLGDLSYDLKKSKILLTSRTGLVNYQLQNFTTYEIEPLTNSQVNEFALKWLGRSSRKFLSEVANTSFSENVKNPLLMAHLLAIFERSGALPVKPKTLYRKTIHLMLEEWDMQRGIKRNSMFASFNTDRKFDFLTAIAYNLTCNFRKVAFSRKDIELIYDSIGKNYNLPEREATEVISELELTTGIFVKAGFDSYHFIHKSIQEFLCAEYMIKRPNSWDLLYLNLPNELAIAVSISSDPSFYFINIVRHLDKELMLNSEFILQFINRLVQEKIDFIKSKELTLSFYYLLTRLILFNQTEIEVLVNTEKIIISFSSPDINSEIKKMYSKCKREQLTKLSIPIDIETITLPENFNCYWIIEDFEGPKILEAWPTFIIIKNI